MSQVTHLAGSNAAPPPPVHHADGTASPTPAVPSLAADSASEKLEDESPGGSSRGSLDTQHDGPHDDAPGPPDLEASRTTSKTPYTTFTTGQRRFIVGMAAMGGFFSAVSANIYFPAMVPLAKEFSVSPSLINLTVTGYQIFQGIMPLMVGDLADSAGRRPAYILCFVIYIGANIGLATCPNYAALLVLRCLQSSGSAPTIALGSGVVADTADSSERGLWMGINTAGSNIAPALGPVIGGLLAEFLGWRSIFWFLTILAGTYLVVFAILFPETSRNVVGNGSIPPPKWNMSLMYYLRTRKGASAANSDLAVQQEAPNKKPLRFPNPLTGLKLLGERDIGLLLVVNALLFSLYYCTLTTTPYFFAKLYKFDQLQIGLCYLPLGVGALCAPLINGRLLDWNFRRTAARLGMTVNRRKASTMKEFPLEQTRLQVIMPFMFSTITFNFIYGWIMHFKAPLPAALVLQFCIGLTNTATFAGMNVFLTDLYPQGPSTVIAANNLCRCTLAAAVSAAIIPAVDAMGAGGAFTLFAGMLFLASPISLLVLKNGPEWRTERKERLARAKAQKQAQKEKERQAKGGSDTSASSINDEKRP